MDNGFSVLVFRVLVGEVPASMATPEKEAWALSAL